MQPQGGGAVHLQVATFQDVKKASLGLLTASKAREPVTLPSLVAAVTVVAHAAPPASGLSHYARALAEGSHSSGYASQPYHGSSCHYVPHHQQGGGHFQQQQAGAPSAGALLDVTELLLAAAVACPALARLHLDKGTGQVQETEAAAIAHMSGLRSLTIASNTTAQPLRRPLLQLLLGPLQHLRELDLSYLRDTTGDMAHLLPQLPHLTKLVLRYAYWGESGAGKRIMASLAKNQQQLEELRLHECGVSDAMLSHITGISSLRALLVQDEDAPEESCPSNKGLAGITRLVHLERLELFGEELRLDTELLALLARLPALRHLAVAGLDALHPDVCQAETEGGRGLADVNELEDMDLSSGDDDECSSSSGAMDDATSRPMVQHHGGSFLHHDDDDHRERDLSLGQRPRGSPSPTAPGTEACSSGRQQQHQQQQGPLQRLPRLTVLRLYGPMSLSLHPPPLALLLPQPCLRELKLSACASHANLRALAQQVGLAKLIISHTSVAHLCPCAYPQAAAYAQHAQQQHGHVALHAVQQPGPPQGPQPHAHAVAAASASAVPSGDSQLSQVTRAGAGAAFDVAALAAAAGGGAQVCSSVLGYTYEVVAGLAQLRILRLKDLPGFTDLHLRDLAVALAQLPMLSELKLRSLNLVTDAGVATLAAVTQLQRLKLYALGGGVSELGIAHAAGALGRLSELRVKDCCRVGPLLHDAVAACRAAMLGSAAAAVVVLLGPQQQA